MKFIVTGEITISVHVEVEAKSVAAARKAAVDMPMMTLCHQCASGAEDYPEEWRTSGEFDGEPTNIRVERS